MTTIRLRSRTIRNYMGDDIFSGCKKISNIHVENEVRTNRVKVEANIRGTSTYSNYSIHIWLSLRSENSIIVDSSCTCPVGDRCKHINKVLQRIHDSRRNPIPGPSRQHREMQVRRQNAENQVDRGACVYIAFSCKSEPETGDWHRHMPPQTKDKFDEKMLGVFFSQRKANRCARNYVRNDLGFDLSDDDDEDEDEDYNFEYDSSELEEFDQYYEKVWVECKAVEDASARFHA